MFLLQTRGTHRKGCEGFVVSNLSISFRIDFHCLQEQDYELQSAVRSFSRQKNLNMAVINKAEDVIIGATGKISVCPNLSWQQRAETANN